MNRQEAKELLPIIQAFAERKVIECRTKPSLIEGSDVPNDWTEIKEIEYWNNIEYRVKPEPKYRPFKDAEECWQEMQKHQPFGWLKDKKDDHYILITAISDTDVDQITSNGNISWMFCSISKFYTFADGTPFGIKE